jgi:hypothetical protein
MSESIWELLVSYGDNPRRKTVTWTGETGEDAALRFVDCMRAKQPTVWATRKPSGQGTVSVLGGATIIG